MTEPIPAYTDPSQNFIDNYPHPLDPLFHPQVIAVIGAKDTPGSVGRTIMTNLMSAHFKGEIYPINPKREHVFGLKCAATLADVPVLIDLAIIITPAATVTKIIEECVQAKVKSVIIISAGFKELGETGLQLENEIVAIARKGNMPIIGPNCLGVMNPHVGLNATFARGMALPGNIAFISQSGAMCTAVLDWSLQERVGFSAFISIGSMADVNWGALIDYLGNDPHTHSLLLYMETIGDARAFMTAAREVALEKPIIVIKPGRSQAAAQAAASHTGSLSGSDEVFEAALERIGVLRVDSISELFSMASLLSKQPLPKGPNLSIITNAGGPAVLATDATVLNGAQLTQLNKETIEELNPLLPAAWSHNNPVDILGDADAERYAKTLEKVAKDPNSDGILIILSPQDMTDATETAEKVLAASVQDKPILTSWMGGETVEMGRKLLTLGKIPCFNYPDDAAKAFAKMWSYSKNLKSLYEMPSLANFDQTDSIDNENQKKQANFLISEVQNSNRNLLSEFESKQLVDIYKIPVVQTYIASSLTEALIYAEKIGYPIVLKLFSDTITHKTDVGGVKLNLQNAIEVENSYHAILDSVTEKAGAEFFQGVTVQKMVKHTGYELILGSSTDPQFGPVILFGMGGQLVEVFKDHALAIPPLTKDSARQLMMKTKVYEALQGVRGMPSVSLIDLENILVNFSRLIIENPQIKECDINPLMASNKQIIALDARIVVYNKNEVSPHSSIRPYPVDYIKKMILKNNLSVVLRPIRPEDIPLMKRFHTELSEHSVYQRFFAFISLDKRIADDRLTRMCFNDYDREMAIIAEITDEAQEKQIIGIGRITRIAGTNFSDLKLTIVDAYHHQGLGTALLKHLIEIAKKENIQILDALILVENSGMIHLCQKLDFEISITDNPTIVRARWQLKIFVDPDKLFEDM